MSGSLWFRLGSLPLWLRCLVCLASAGLVVWVSFMTPTMAGGQVWSPVLHQAAHGPLFGILAGSILLLLGPQSPLRLSSISLTVLVVGLAGFADEWHQMFVPTRASDLHDVVTDLIGAVGAVLLARWASRTPIRWGAGLLLLLVLGGLLFAWASYSYDATPLDLPFLHHG